MVSVLKTVTSHIITMLHTYTHINIQLNQNIQLNHTAILQQMSVSHVTQCLSTMCPTTSYYSSPSANDDTWNNVTAEKSIKQELDFPATWTTWRRWLQRIFSWQWSCHKHLSTRLDVNQCIVFVECRQKVAITVDTQFLHTITCII